MNKSRTSSDTIEDFSSTLTYIELTVIGTIMTVLCAVTIIGNALVIISFIVDKKLRTLSNYFLLSLAVSDMMIGTFSMPLFITYLLVGEWTLGRILCDMWLAQDYTCCCASCINLLMISFDRYFSVTNPLKHRARRTPRRVGVMIGIVWLISFLLWPPWIYAWPYIEGRRTVPEDDCYVQFLETNPYVTIITAIIDYYGPVTIMLVLYYKIWRIIRRRNKYLANMDSEYQYESKCLQKNDSCCKTLLNEQPLGTTTSNNVVDSSVHTNLSTDGDGNKNTAIPLLQIKKREKEGKIYDDEYNAEMEKFSASNVSEVDCKALNDTIDSNTRSLLKTERPKSDKAARVLTAILLAFLVTTTPYNVLTIIYTLDKTHSLLPNYLLNFAYFWFYVNSTLNPVCYALANENFRKTYWEILTFSWNKKFKYALHDFSNKSSQNVQNSDAKNSTSFS